jgi:Fe-S-cluster containining protein
MRLLRKKHPATADKILTDARRALETLKHGFPGDADSGRLTSDEQALDRFFERHEPLVCPVLDRRTGSCRLYGARPVSCRTFGPPLLFEGRPAPHCDLCFRGRSAQTVEACRWTPDPADLEQRLLRGLGVKPGDDWETLIAHAVVGNSGVMETP